MALYLVTGGAGFIGSNLVEELVRQGSHVRVIDNFATGKPENLKPFDGRIDFREVDICDLKALKEAVRGVDYVLHQAAIPSVPKSVIDPISSHNADLTGTLHVLWAAKEAGVKRLVYAASSSAYGDNPELPKREDMPSRAISPYGLMKYVGEEYCRLFTQLYGLETVSLRYFNVFGPRQDPSSPVLRCALPIHHHNAGREEARDLRRRRAKPGFHLCRQCRPGKPAGLPRLRGSGQNVQSRLSDSESTSIKWWLS